MRDDFITGRRLSQRFGERRRQRQITVEAVVRSLGEYVADRMRLGVIEKAKDDAIAGRELVVRGGRSWRLPMNRPGFAGGSEP